MGGVQLYENGAILLCEMGGVQLCENGAILLCELPPFTHRSARNSVEKNVDRHLRFPN